MAAVLTNEVLQDELAVSVAQILASANKKALELGYDAKKSLISISQHLSNGIWLWRVHYGTKDYVGRRGGDLIIDVDAADASVRQILKGQ